MLYKFQGLWQYEVTDLWYSVLQRPLLGATHFRLFILKGEYVITNVKGKRLLAIRNPYTDILLRIAGDICGKCFLLLLSFLARPLLILPLSSTLLTLPSLMPLRENLLKNLLFIQ